MADRTPARSDRHDETPAEDAETPTRPTPLTERWWWTGGALALVGAVVIGWQWDVISKGDAIPATWAVVGLGAIAVVAGGVILWRDRGKR